MNRCSFAPDPMSDIRVWDFSFLLSSSSDLRI